MKVSSSNCVRVPLSLFALTMVLGALLLPTACKGEDGAPVSPGPRSAHVAGIDTGTESFGGEDYSVVKAWILVLDAEGEPVAGAKVAVEVARPDNQVVTEMATTGSDGIALIEHPTTYRGPYTFTVTDVQAEGVQYDPDANIVSSASVMLDL